MTTNFYSPEEWLGKSRIIAGVMTGTSLDAIDTAIVEFTQEDEEQHRLKLIAKNSIPYEFAIKQDILDIISLESSIRKITRLHYKLAYSYADALSNLIKDSGLDSVEAVGIHGQTIWHEPGKETEGRITFQLGAVSALAQLLDTTVVGNFREADTALGGQGAPLVPIFDYQFFGNDKDDIITVNIGGVSNITLLPSGCKQDTVKAFDTGPGNVLIDTAMKVFYNRAYDKNGEIAKTGTIVNPLLDMLKEIDFIYQEPPKSTGRELFGVELVHQILDKYAQKYLAKDIITTLTFFTAWAIAHNIKLFGKTTSDVILSGGGSHNEYILESLAQELPEAKIRISDEIGIPADSKEAICFAYLAYRTLGGLTSNIPSVTGASRKAILGVVAQV